LLKNREGSKGEKKNKISLWKNKG